MRSCFILGSGRSGTSMLAGCLVGAGYHCGPRPYPARDSNPRGFFESPVVNRLNEALLTGVVPRRGRLSVWLSRSSIPGPGQQWLARMPLDVEIRSTSAVEQRIVRLVSRTPFCLKDPRFCYTLAPWRTAAPEALCVCIFRDPAQTVESMLQECQSARYLARFQLSREQAMEVWCLMYGHILARHAEHGDWLFVHYEQVLGGTVWNRLERALGTRLDRTFPERALHRTRGTGDVTPAAASIYRELCTRAEWTGPAER